ncbi:MAG: hypothetical protein HKN88_05670 [Gammaproteobacteria bacterium]|nr:hypothetical protein [Gammaproteobacteria bacterium]NNC97543.1 hypothetical protein [Gammaproteobacteria bacterium]
MLFRRIKAHIEKENWFAVFLDFLIVVVGILLAFQITNWNEDWVDSKRESQILAAIQKDLLTDQKVLNTGIEMANLNINVGNYLLSKAGLASIQKIVVPVEVGVILSQTEFEVTVPGALPEQVTSNLWKHVAFRYHPTQSNAAFSSLVTAGDLTIISDVDLASELQGYNQAWQSLSGSQDLTFRVFRDRLVFVGQEYGLSPFHSGKEDELIELLRINRKLAGALRTMTEYAILHREALENLYQRNLLLSKRLND